MIAQSILAAVARKRVASGGFVPTDIAGCVLWLDSATLALSDGDPVSTWTDGSGQANDATGTLTARPLFKTNIINGHPVVRFDGSDDFLSTIDTVGVPLTIFFLGRTLTTPGGNEPFLGFAASFGIFPYHNASDQIAAYGGASVFASGNIVATTPFIGTFILDGASSLAQINNIAAGTGDSGVGGSGVIQIGAGGGFFTDIDILQLVIYDSHLGASDVQDVQDYLAAIGGISL